MTERLIGLALGGITLLIAAAVCWLLGRRLRPWLSTAGLEGGFLMAIELIAGVSILHILLSALDLVRVPWRPLPLLMAIVVIERATNYWARRSKRFSTPLVTRDRWGWGDSLALVALAVFGLWALLGWAVSPDYIYHWGVKGQRFFLAEGIDVDFLTLRWSYFAHPGYPNLLPGLFAATATLGGAFREPAMFGWSALFAALFWPIGRQILGECGVGTFTRQSTLAALALVTAMFGIGYLMSGGPDTLIALVPLAAWPAMLRVQRPLAGEAEMGGPNPTDADLRATDLHIGFVATLSASSKMEGIPLAALVVGIYLVLRWRQGRGARRGARRQLSSLLGAVARSSLLPLATVSMWIARGQLSGLFVEQPRSGFHLDRLPVMLSSMVEAASVSEWHGVAWILLLLPVLLLPRFTRPVATLCMLQLAFYATVYLTAAAPDLAATRFYVLTSFSRLLFHLVPTTLVASAIALDCWVRATKATDPATE